MKFDEQDDIILPVELIFCNILLLLPISSSFPCCLYCLAMKLGLSRYFLGLTFMYKLLYTHASTIPRLRVSKPVTIHNIGLQSRDIRCILSDIDGTLVSRHRKFDDRTYSTISDVMMKGYPFFPCTGRTRKSAAAVLGPKFVSLYGKTEFDMPGVYQQGLSVYGDRGQLIYRNALDLNTLQELLDLCDRYHVPVLAYADDSSYCKEYIPEIQEIVEASDHIPIEVGNSLNKLHQNGIHIQKLIFVRKDGSLEQLIPLLAPLFRDRIEVLKFSSGILEILPTGACKGKGAGILLRHFNVSPSKTIAFGDGINDVEMLSMVKYGVAMGNGHKSLIAQAKYVTNTVDDFGVAKVLDSFI
jgi:Cof subfamily protein (haloacid dehalogenase superfamily)